MAITKGGAQKSKKRATVTRAELERRAASARERLRKGVFTGPGVSDRIDAIVSAVPRPRRAAPR